jgi:chromosome partitioning protein
MNQQTQVGKTVTTLNLGYALALMNKKVTLIDMDPKAQLSLDCQLTETESGIHQVLQGERTIEQAQNHLAEGFDVVSVGSNLIDYEQTGEGETKLQLSYKLKQAIEAMAQQQDFILIDCPSEPGLLTVNALLAAGEIMVPTKPNYLSLQGLVRIVNLFKRLKKLSGGAKLWLVLTQMNHADKMTSEVKEMLMAYFPQRLFNTVIRQDEAVAESQSHKKAIFDYHQESEGAADYFSLAQDLIEGRVS